MNEITEESGDDKYFYKHCACNYTKNKIKNIVDSLEEINENHMEECIKKSKGKKETVNIKNLE
eukprot:1055823-Amphidinium_carterae.1